MLWHVHPLRTVWLYSCMGHNLLPCCTCLLHSNKFRWTPSCTCNFCCLWLPPTPVKGGTNKKKIHFSSVTPPHIPSTLPPLQFSEKSLEHKQEFASEGYVRELRKNTQPCCLCQSYFSCYCFSQSSGLASYSVLNAEVNLEKMHFMLQQAYWWSSGRRRAWLI